MKGIGGGEIIECLWKLKKVFHGEAAVSAPLLVYCTIHVKVVTWSNMLNFLKIDVDEQFSYFV